MNQLHIAAGWSDSGPITFKQLSGLTGTPKRLIRDWRQRNLGRQWARLNGSDGHRVILGKAHRFFDSPPANPSAASVRAGEAS